MMILVAKELWNHASFCAMHGGYEYHLLKSFRTIQGGKWNQDILTKKQRF